LAESQSVPISKLSDQSSGTVTKEIAQQIPTPKIQADLGVGTNKISDFGSSDLKKP
jgi:hypothetical protein